MSVERLQRLLDCVREYDAGLYSWFAPALAEYRNGLPLEQALGLAGPRAIRERDAALVAAAEALDPYRDLSRSARAGELAHQIDIFTNVTLPRCLDVNAKPAGALNEALWRAWQTGLRIPRTQRALYDVMKNSE